MTIGQWLEEAFNFDWVLCTNFWRLWTEQGEAYPYHLRMDKMIKTLDIRFIRSFILAQLLSLSSRQVFVYQSRHPRVLGFAWRSTLQ